MANYLSPGVYAESVNNANAPITAIGGSTGGFVGITVRGELNKPILITSWQNFLDTFAYGMETPFLANSDLAYSVYGFFQNGGTKCYVIRTAKTTGESGTASKSFVNIGSETPTAVITAKDEGTWGDKLSIKITSAGTDGTVFDISVKYDGDEVEKFTGVTNNTTEVDYFVNVIKGSKYISCNTGTISATEGTTYSAFSGGNDGITGIADTDYVASLNLFNSVDDVNLICIPGQTSANMTNAILSYADARGSVFAILDAPKATIPSGVSAYRSSVTGKNGAMYYPWIKVTDPLSRTGALRDCPTCGHVMGVYARTIQERGVWKAPAGTEAVLRGAVDVCQFLSKAEVDILNPLGVNVIMPRANYGIVVWGARSLNPDDSMKYVSDVLLNVNIKESIKNSTQWAVFEPNNSVLWTRVQTTIEAFLDSLWRSGGLVGSRASEAYFVKCDAEINPEDSRNEGKLICEVGYAPTKPAEFVIFRISHSISNN